MHSHETEGKSHLLSERRLHMLTIGSVTAKPRVITVKDVIRQWNVFINYTQTLGTYSIPKTSLTASYKDRLGRRSREVRLTIHMDAFCVWNLRIRIE